MNAKLMQMHAHVRQDLMREAEMERLARLATAKHLPSLRQRAMAASGQALVKAGSALVNASQRSAQTGVELEQIAPCPS